MFHSRWCTCSIQYCKLLFLLHSLLANWLLKHGATVWLTVNFSLYATFLFYGITYFKFSANWTVVKSSQFAVIQNKIGLDKYEMFMILLFATPICFKFSLEDILLGSLTFDCIHLVLFPLLFVIVDMLQYVNITNEIWCH